MKYLKFMLPILILFVFSCDSITGPEDKPKEKEEEKDGYNVNLKIKKPENNSVFDQKKETIPCKAEVSPDTVSVSWSLRWPGHITGLDCEEGKIPISRYNEQDNGEYKLQASVRHNNGDYTKDSVTIEFRPKPEVEITLPKMKDLRMAGSLNNPAERFMYTQSADMWLRAKAKDSQGNEFTGTIEWIINGDVVATSDSEKDVSIKAKSSYGEDSNLIAKVTNSNGLSWSDTLRFGVSEKLILMSGEHRQNNKNWNTVRAHYKSGINSIFHKNGEGHSLKRSFPALSRNGRNAVFTTGEKLGREKLSISNYDFSSSKEIEIPDNLGLINTPRFSPSGNTIAFTSFEGNPLLVFFVSHIYLYDIKSKTTTKIKNSCKKKESYPCWGGLYHSVKGNVGRLAFTPDGHIITSAYEVLSEDEARVAIIKIDPSSGSSEFIWRDKRTSNPESIKPQVYDVSPNGKWISLTAWETSSKTDETRKRIAVLKTDGSMESPRFITPQLDDWTRDPDWPIFIDNNTVCHTKNDQWAGNVQYRDLQGNVLDNQTFWSYRIEGLYPHPNF